MKDVAVITLHGVGFDDKGYSAPLRANLRKKIRTGKDRFTFHAVDYFDVLDGPAAKLWEEILAANRGRLDKAFLRKVLLLILADASVLGYGAKQNSQAYLAVQRRIAKTLNDAYDELDDKKSPVVLVASSLGAQVIANYLWDVQHDKWLFFKDVDFLPEGVVDTPDRRSFLQLETLENFVTLGCNIPLFTAGLSKREPFSNPNRVSGKFTWDNLYDRDDMLGWPLRQLGPEYADMVNDIEVSVGDILRGLTVLCHIYYWEDRDVASHIAQIIRSKF